MAEHFLARFAADLERPPPRLSNSVQELLTGYSWPGNVRELRNLMERAVLLCESGVVEPNDLPERRMRATVSVEQPRLARPRTGSHVPSVTREQIVAALSECGGNQTRAAEKLGVSRRTLTKWLTRYQLPRPRKDR
jgi:DNA-binding NtrC family response regulator